MLPHASVRVCSILQLPAIVGLELGRVAMACRNPEERRLGPPTGLIVARDLCYPHES